MTEALKHGVFAGRYTAEYDESFVVFLIGMRVNQFWNFRKWMPVAGAMNPMLQVLYSSPELGFLGGESFFRFWPLVSCLVTYWRSFEDLEHFAKSKDQPHLEPWRKFNQAVGGDGTVGIWHETYKVEAGAYECIYGNMPRFGLASATKHVSITSRRESARQRIEAEKALEAIR
jgi:hypothetical protein